MSETTDRDQLSDLEERLGYRFADRTLLERALAHRSWAYEQGHETHYERLEFLGDAILGAIASAWLYDRVDEPEGGLSKLKGYLVSAPVIASHAARLGIGESLRLGVGEERSGGREKESLLADSFEAVIGALYLDGGLDVARRAVLPLLEEGLAALDATETVTDPKTAVQERVQAEGLELPEYRLIEARGPDHRKRFTVEIRVAGTLLARGEGSSKKKAEQAAAAKALRRIGG